LKLGLATTGGEETGDLEEEDITGALEGTTVDLAIGAAEGAVEGFAVGTLERTVEGIRVITGAVVEEATGEAVQKVRLA